MSIYFVDITKQNPELVELTPPYSSEIATLARIAIETADHTHPECLLIVSGFGVGEISLIRNGGLENVSPIAVNEGMVLLSLSIRNGSMLCIPLGEKVLCIEKTPDGRLVASLMDEDSEVRYPVLFVDVAQGRVCPVGELEEGLRQRVEQACLQFLLSNERWFSNSRVVIVEAGVEVQTQSGRSDKPELSFEGLNIHDICLLDFGGEEVWVCSKDGKRIAFFVEDGEILSGLELSEMNTAETGN